MSDVMGHLCQTDLFYHLPNMIKSNDSSCKCRIFNFSLILHKILGKVINISVFRFISSEVISKNPRGMSPPPPPPPTPSSAVRVDNHFESDMQLEFITLF